MKIYAATVKGIGKTYSEDRILIENVVLEDTVQTLEMEKMPIIGVCDGVGGNAGGALAAEYLCRNAYRYLSDDPENGAKQLAAALLEYARGFSQERYMASTMTMLLPSQNVIVHVGNTRVWRMIRGCLRQITSDHTTRQILLQQNRMDAADAVPPNELSGCMGGGSPQFSAWIEVLPMPSGDLVLTSDGIHDTLSQDEVELLLLAGVDMQENIENIVRIAAEKGSKDDRSIVVIQQ